MGAIALGFRIAGGQTNRDLSSRPAAILLYYNDCFDKLMISQTYYLLLHFLCPPLLTELTIINAESVPKRSVSFYLAFKRTALRVLMSIYLGRYCY